MDLTDLRAIHLSTPVLVFTGAVSLVTAIVCGLAPAFEGSRADVQESLKDGARQVGAGVRHRRMRQAFVIAEIALAVVLLVGAGLMIRSFSTLRRVNPGFDPGNVLTARLTIPTASYPTDTARITFFSTLVARAAALPGVQSAGAISYLPLSGGGAATGFTIVGEPPPDVGHVPVADVRVCDDGYFQAMRVPLVSGRLFSEREMHERADVVIINETLARRYFPRGDALGKRLVIDMTSKNVPTQIVGVVADVNYRGFAEETRPMTYWPHPQLAYSAMTLTIRTHGDAGALTPLLAREVHALDRDQPIADVRTMDQWVSRSLSQARFNSTLLTAFAIVALLLAAVGIYGVMSYAVSQRTAEIGIRLALGAEAKDILRMIIGACARLAALRLAIGVVLALALSRTLDEPAVRHRRYRSADVRGRGRRARVRRPARRLSSRAPRRPHSSGRSAEIPMLDTLLQDLRYAARTFRRAPGFLLLTVLTIAVGVGANAAIFSIVHAVLLRPLPFPRPNDLVTVSDANRQTKLSNLDASPANFLDWRVRQHAFTGMAAYREASFALSTAEHPERITGAIVNANFFDVLGLPAAIGRVLQPADEQAGAPRVAILSDGLWRTHFSAGRDIVGQTVRVNDELHTIVGVMAPGIDFPDKSALWVSSHWRVPDDPLLPTADPTPQRDRSYFSVLARIRPGRTLEQAQVDMDAVALTLEHDYPAINNNLGAIVTPLRAELVSNVRATLILLFAAVALLLLIAAANVSGLLIARATARHQEMAVRIALGASRSRIVTQLLTESVVLALLGGAGGVRLATWLIGPLVALSPSDLTVAGTVTVDRSVLLFCLAVSALAGVTFGLAPAQQLLRVNVHDDLKQSARGGTGAGQRRLRAAIVAAEIALSLVLLVGSGLTIRSLVKLQQQPAGFNPERVLTLTVNLPATRYASAAQRADFWEHAIDSLRQVPGIQLAGATSRLPLLPGNSTRVLNVPSLPAGSQPSAWYRTASPDYFATMGIPILSGRGFEDADREGRPLVAVVSASAARRFWPDRNPIGEHFSISAPDIVVVGVVGDVHSAALDAPVQPTVYVPYRQDPWPFTTLAVRTAGAPSALVASVRDAIWQVDKDLPIGLVRTMDEQMEKSLTRRRFSVTLLTVFGGVAVSLAAIGLYGVLAFIVAQRRREIGVRMALGAQARDVIVDVLGQGLRLAGVGIAAGVALALAATRRMTNLLFGTSPTDALTFAAVAALLVAVTVAASLVPALRASRVDPLIALREE